jgi:hypothetical protein
MLDSALHEAVLDLKRHEGRPSSQIGERLHFGDTPCGCIADAEIEDLPRPDEVVEATHHLVRPGRHVPSVQVEEIDAIGAELPEALLSGPHQVEAMVAAGIRVAGLSGHRELRREDEPLTLVADKFSHEAFGGAVGVVHRDIDEVAAPIDVEIEDATGFGDVGAPAPLRPKGHGAQAQRRNAQTRAS